MFLPFFTGILHGLAVASAGRDESSIVASESENQTRLWKQRRLPEFRKQRVLGVEDRGLSVSTQTVNSAEWGFNQEFQKASGGNSVGLSASRQANSAGSGESA